ncbi:MAG: homoserine dehydrogenase [Planctomycetaceae bacterium]|nr:homoserine dehydrogenase [Planctomycetaceae bacterium]
MTGMEKTLVALVGMGTVGTGVAKLLLDHGDRTARHAGRTLWVQHIVVKDPTKARDADIPAGLISTDLLRLLKDSDVKVVAHLMGGLEPARTVMLQLLESGKDVVTANKALLAEHGPELFDRARQLGRTIAFEASVGGGIPIIANISQCLAANQILSLQGILNGTSNFIITNMQEQGVPYSAALLEAQRLGYAEADPTFDVDGSDAAQKLAILAHLAFGARVHWRQIPRRGIDQIQANDLRYASDMGFSLKLLAAARLNQAGLELHVSPTLIPRGTPLAEVRSNFNAINVVGDAVGPVFFHGQGAGQMPTASAVVADMIDVAVGRAAITFGNLKLWSEQPPRVDLRDHAYTKSKYYFRFDVADQPGVLAQIAGILGRHQISIASVHQYDRDKDPVTETVPLVIVTHSALEQHTGLAQREIQNLDVVRAKGERLRILTNS